MRTYLPRLLVIGLFGFLALPQDLATEAFSGAITIVHGRAGAMASAQAGGHAERPVLSGVDGTWQGQVASRVDSFSAPSAAGPSRARGGFVPLIVSVALTAMVLLVAGLTLWQRRSQRRDDDDDRW